MTQQEAFNQLRDAARGVVRFDWSDNDDDAVNAIDRLQDAVADTMPEKITRQNFCPDCGKRNGPEGHIHTCTPPD
jgi:hypothetical protein